MSAARQAALAPAPISASTAAAAAAPIIAALSQNHAPAPAAPAPRAATAPDSDAMKDLERLFKIRDQELSKSGDGGPAVGYESTQPSPL
jgi:hypothetical protein